MSFRIRREPRPNSLDRDPTIWILEDGTGGALEVWPALGFNAFRWSAQGREMLYRNPSFFDEMRPSRSGFPILFPFPNRIRDGRFKWQGRDFVLPCNDPAGKNAIHGFVHVAPWTVVDHGANDHEAWITAEVLGSRDAPHSLALWPGDYALRVTYRLAANALRIEAAASNPGGEPLPWGLGYHPYFRVEPFGGSDALVRVPARTIWELDECLPSGRKIPVAPAKDLRSPRRFGDLQLDDVYSDIVNDSLGDASGALAVVGVMENPERTARFALAVSPEFREMVIFTPPHREAICLEPYTCVTDAVHLQSEGIDAGLRTLAPGATWSGAVECRCAWR